MTGFNSKRDAAADKQEPVANSFEEYCKTLHPLWNTHISRTYAEQFFRAGQSAQPAQEPMATVTATVTSETGNPDVTMSWWHEPALPVGTQLYTASPQPAQKPVAHPVISGALFDFMGWLTSRKERIVLSSADNTSPAVEAITEFARMRNLSLDDARVQDWRTTPPKRPWVGLEKSDMPDEENPMFDHKYFIAGMVFASNVLKEKNT